MLLVGNLFSTKCDLNTQNTFEIVKDLTKCSQKQLLSNKPN